MNKPLRKLAILATAAIAAAATSSAAWAEDKLLKESVDFNGTFIFLAAKAPGLIFGAVQNGESAFAGFGETADGSKKEPDGDSLFRIGSISKAFCGTVLSGLLIDGKTQLTDRLQDHLAGADVPVKDGRPIRLLDLVTQTSGLPREVTRP